MSIASYECFEELSISTSGISIHSSSVSVRSMIVELLSMLCMNYVQLAVVSIANVMEYPVWCQLAHMFNSCTCVNHVYSVVCGVYAHSKPCTQALGGRGKESLVLMWDILYSGKLWRVLNLVNRLSVGIGKFLIWRSEFLAP